jgi:molecular chaperone GrpE
MPERKKKAKKTEPETAPAAEAEEALESGAAAEVEPEAAEPEVPGPEVDPVAVLEAEAASLKDQLLRALAETENLRRRSQRERQDAVKYAAAPLIKDLVGVADNLRRAMDSVSSEALEADPHLKTLMAGLELTEKELDAVFERHHIVKIEPLGERLDPHNHEAMFEIPDPEAMSGTVLQVLQVGYRLHDRLLRPAQVGVARGRPAPAPETAAEAPEASEPGPESEPEAAAEPAAEPAGDNGEVPPGSTIDTTA